MPRLLGHDKKVVTLANKSNMSFAPATSVGFCDSEEYCITFYDHMFIRRLRQACSWSALRECTFKCR